MIYACIDQLQQKAEAVAPLCKVLGVSRSGYYASQQRAREPVKLCRESTHLQAAFAASGRCYGSRRLRVALQDQGLAVGRYRVRTFVVVK